MTMSKLAVHDYCCCGFLCHCFKAAYANDGQEAFDDDAVGLSHVGEAAYECLRKQHNWYHHRLWNVTSGQVKAIDQTPHQAFKSGAAYIGHSDWFPKKLASMVAMTEIWCDVSSLGPPDGDFMTELNKALIILHEKNKKIVVRMMFGNIIGMPVNCNSVIRRLTTGIPDTTHLRLWVGAWRKGVSWNHSKIIAVDGWYLHTGGHNLWDPHYLRHNPVHDLSMELEGRVAHDGHLYLNEQWAFIQSMQSSICGYVIDKLPDSWPVALKSRVTVSEFPRHIASEFPPSYRKGLIPRRLPPRDFKQVPIISMGRYGKLTPFGRRPADDAFIAMVDSATTIIRMALQDLGPVCIPGTKITVPGCVWPHPYLSALGRAIWNKSVEVEIVLSNAGSIPGGLKPTEASYGNGWSCVDVAAEIIKTIRQQFPSADDLALRKKVTDNLRVTFLRETIGQRWADGMTMAMHAKHFIVDDVCYYIGSQNWYICDLAEWGCLIDNEEATKVCMAEYWNPLWKASYRPEDCVVQDVMDGLEIDRDGENPHFVSSETKQKMEAAEKKSGRNFYDAPESVTIKPSDMGNYYTTDEKKEE